MTIPTFIDTPVKPKWKPTPEQARQYQRKWRANNPEKAAAIDKRYAQAHPDRLRVASIKWREKSPRNVLLMKAKSNAKRKGLDCDLTLDDIMLPEFCPVLGIKLEYKGEGSRTDATATIDRMDNEKGYVKGNVVVVSWRANWLKSDATIPELIALANFYRSKVS